MKKLVLVLMVALAIVSCQKKENQPTPPATQDVTFSVTEITPDLKSTDDWECKTDVPTHAWVQIEGVDYYPELFELDGQLYTQAIKLAVGTYCIQDFVLYKEVINAGYDPGDDITVFGTPHAGTHYAVYVDKPVNLDPDNNDACSFDFTVTDFAKAELDIQVLCFQDADYQDFGFDWFAITEIVIRQFCFFGDICITNDMYGAFDNSIYDLTGGLDPDEEAVFRVIVKDGDEEVPYSPFSNLDFYGTGSALCVDYPDNLSEVNNFTFELQVWVPSAIPGLFTWQTYAIFTSTDAGNLFYGNEDLGDNTTVKSFAIGDCSPDSNPIFTWLDPPTPPVIINGQPDNFTGAASVRFKGNNSGNEFYLGVPDLGFGGNRVETGFTWANTTYTNVTFEYSLGDNSITAKIGSKTLVYDFDTEMLPNCDVSGWNTMDIYLKDKADYAGMEIQNFSLNGYNLGNIGLIDIPGAANDDHYYFEFDLNQSFMVTFDLVVDGWVGPTNVNEREAVEVYVGCK